MLENVFVVRVDGPQFTLDSFRAESVPQHESIPLFFEIGGSFGQVGRGGHIEPRDRRFVAENLTGDIIGRRITQIEGDIRPQALE